MNALVTKREAAAELLTELFDGTTRIAIADAVAAGTERGISRRTLRRVGAEMGVRVVLNGRHGGIWEKENGGNSMKCNTRPMSPDEQIGYLLDHPSPEDTAARSEAAADVMHELSKIRQPVKVTVTDLIKAEYARARTEGREPSVHARVVLIKALNDVIHRAVEGILAACRNPDELAAAWGPLEEMGMVDAIGGAEWRAALAAIGGLGL